MNKPLNEMTQDELIAYASSLEKKNGSKTVAGLQYRVGAKGGVSVYGLGRFPVTLYSSQWKRLIAAIPDVQAFLTDNAGQLKEKPAAE